MAEPAGFEAGPPIVLALRAAAVPSGAGCCWSPWAEFCVPFCVCAGGFSGALAGVSFCRSLAGGVLLFSAEAVLVSPAGWLVEVSWPARADITSGVDESRTASARLRMDVGHTRMEILPEVAG